MRANSPETALSSSTVPYLKIKPKSLFVVKCILVFWSLFIEDFDRFPYKRILVSMFVRSAPKRKTDFRS